MLRVGVTINYNTEEEEFDELQQTYPTGAYHSYDGANWFRVEIDSQNGVVQLTWFLK